MRCTRAIIRLPGPNFADGLTTSGLGIPDLNCALAQHASYGAALRDCGLDLTVLPADPLYPDGTFVEDTAIITPRGALLTRPGAPSRRGEVEQMREALERDFPRLAAVSGEGRLDAGDVLEAGGCYFIGVGRRTNEAGAQQAAAWLASLGLASSLVDIIDVPELLHLKSGVSYLGDGRLAVVGALSSRPEFCGFERVIMTAGEEYAANCVRVTDRVLIAKGYPVFQQSLRDLGYETVEVEMSEFRKMDGGLSCLSLRY